MNKILMTTAVVGRMTGYTAVLLVSQNRAPELCAGYGLILASEVVQAGVMTGLWYLSRRKAKASIDAG